MEDSGIVSKKWILFIGITLLIVLVVAVIYALNNEKKSEPVTGTDNPKTPDIQEIDESFMYGKFINEKDKNSYLEITKDGFKYVMNICEGYATYNSNDYVFTKEITDNDGLKSATIKITSKRSDEIVNMTFNGSSKTEISEFTGTITCSESNKYKKTLEN